MARNVVQHVRTYVVLSLCLLLCFSNLNSLLAQDETPPVEPPTSEPPTATFTELPPPTATDTELPPPIATFTEFPSPTATLTETPLPTLTFTETETGLPTTTLTETPSASATASPTLTSLPSETATMTLTPTFTPMSTLPPTPGTTDYSAWLLEVQSSTRQRDSLYLQTNECSTFITQSYAVVAPTTVNNRAVDFYAAVAQAHQGGSASPYPIYLCEGTFPLNETVVLFANIHIYGRGVGSSTITQSNTTTMGGMFTLNGNLLEFHNVTVYGGSAFGIANEGGVARIWSGILGIYDSKFETNSADFGGVIGGGMDVTIWRSHFVSNTASYRGGTINVGDVDASCVRFDSNHTNDGVGGAISIFGDGNIINSSFTGNTATQGGNHIFDHDWNSVTNAQGNWWATPPQYPVDVSGGINTGMQLLDDPTAIYATGDYYNPSSPCAMLPAPSLIEHELAFYGVTLNGTWNDEAELYAIVNAIRRTAQALFEFSYYEPVTIFNSVMAAQGIQFTRTSTSENNCITNKNSTPMTITCRGNVVITEHLIVHELGHVFVGRTSSGSVTYFGRVENPEDPNQPLRDYQNQFVMGPRGWFDENNNPQTDWQRSDRVTDNGWGSAALIPGPCDGSIIPPPGAPFPFQQNPCEVDSWLYSPGSPVRIAEVEEAAADMFLNWVYRMTSYDYMTNTWEGFLNALWRNHESPPNSGIILQCYPDGCSDEMGYPGDSRFEWMWNALDELFAAYGWY